MTRLDKKFLEIHFLALMLSSGLVVSTTVSTHAHSGGLDANGCHAGSKPYHCHRSPSEMVENRLRCDLGSKSVDCIRSTTNGVQPSPPVAVSDSAFKCPSSEIEKSAMVRQALDRGDVDLYQKVTNCNQIDSATGNTHLSDWKRDFSGSSGGQVRMKNVACEKGKWRLDLVNRRNKTAIIGYTFWTEDQDGDSLGSYNDSLRLKPMARTRLSTNHNCTFKFENIKMRLEFN